MTPEGAVEVNQDGKFTQTMFPDFRPPSLCKQELERPIEGLKLAATPQSRPPVGRYMPKPLDTGHVQQNAIQNPVREPAPQEKVPNGDHLSHDARVSVAQLRHTYLESVAIPRKAEL